MWSRFFEKLPQICTSKPLFGSKTRFTTTFHPRLTKIEPNAAVKTLLRPLLGYIKNTNRRFLYQEAPPVSTKISCPPFQVPISICPLVYGPTCLYNTVPHLHNSVKSPLFGRASRIRNQPRFRKQKPPKNRPPARPFALKYSRVLNGDLFHEPRPSGAPCCILNPTQTYVNYYLCGWVYIRLRLWVREVNRRAEDFPCFGPPNPKEQWLFTFRFTCVCHVFILNHFSLPQTVFASICAGLTTQLT